MDDCIIYDGHITSRGYGIAYDTERPGHRTFAHRIAFEAYYGPIRDGAYILHACDNPPCINPHHLRQGTPQENMDDKMARNRHPLASRDHCPNGHPFDESNTYRHGNTRQCRICNAERARRYRSQRKGL